MARHDAKQTVMSKAPKRATRTNKQLHQTLITTTTPLTQQTQPHSSLATRKQKKPSFNSQFSSDDSSTDSPVQLQYSESPTNNMNNTEDDLLSDATDQMDNTIDQLLDTRVDIKIKMPPSETPEETTTYILQQFLLKLKSYDNKVSFAPWKDNTNTKPIFSHADIPTRPSEIELFFPRIRFMKTGTTWYSGLRLVHTIPITDLRKDMLPWLKDEGHGLFTRTLQAENLVDVGWFVYSTWEMEADSLAAAISKFISIEVGLRWKMISLGTRERIPPDLQVRALHIEVAVENRMAAQKALLAVYGRKNSGSYPNGIRLRFALPIGAAYNLNTKAKLEKLRSRQLLWNKTYKKGQSWEITQLDFTLTDSLTLRQALTQIMSTTDARFPLFHSVDRATGKMSGITFQFLPELESEARLMISNLLPYLHHHYGEIANKCFTPSAVERLTDCKWDPQSGSIVGAYDDEINFLDESDLMSQYISSKSNPPPTTPEKMATQKSAPPTPLNPTILQTTAYGNDDDSVSTLGQYTAKKWSPATPKTKLQPPFPVPNTITHSLNPPPNDDRSVGSISTLNTRINSIEGQFQELTGTMEHIKNMLNLLTNTKTTPDEDPRSLDKAGRGNSAGSSS